jgi:hypothetical protein
MRADLTFMALAHESNRYLLTQLIAKATANCIALTPGCRIR